MFKKLLTIMLISTVGVGLSGCNIAVNKKQVNTQEGNASKIKIVASINPVREFAQAVGGDKVEVTTLVPEGVEAHDFEPKPKDIEMLSKANIFVYSGVGMEGWLDKVLQTVSSKKNLNVVDTSEGATLMKIDGDAHDEDKEEDHDHNDGEYDPHLWLSLKEAKVQALNIKDVLIKVDEKNKDYYEKNYTEFAGKLDSLYDEYKKKIDGLPNKNFVTGHTAFAYLCRDFGLIQKGISGIRAEGEPTPQKMKELVEYAKKNNIKTIFMEEMASPKVSETLAKEVGAKVEKIYTIENKEDNKTYLEMMKDNLEKIYNSLK